jgi:uncharacterized membrane protein YhaH (DUF805 family)
VSKPQPPLGHPWYGATFTGALSRFWRSYVLFRGRASRSEFWWVMLWYLVLSAALNGVFLASTFPGMMSADAPPKNLDFANPFAVWGYEFTTLSTAARVALGVYALVLLAALLPLIGLAVRRLHDANRSGWWVLLYYVPLFNVILGFLLLLDSDARGARFDAKGTP